MHFNFDDAVALAGFAATALDVERETTGAVAACAGLRYPGEQFADWRQQAGVSRWIGSWCATDRRLIDVDDFVELVEADDPVMFGGFGGGALEIFCGGGIKGVIDQRRLP